MKVSRGKTDKDLWFQILLSPHTPCSSLLWIHSHFPEQVNTSILAWNCKSCEIWDPGASSQKPSSQIFTWKHPSIRFVISYYSLRIIFHCRSQKLEPQARKVSIRGWYTFCPWPLPSLIWGICQVYYSIYFLRAVQVIDTEPSLLGVLECVCWLGLVLSSFFLSQFPFSSFLKLLPFSIALRKKKIIKQNTFLFVLFDFIRFKYCIF